MAAHDLALTASDQLTAAEAALATVDGALATALDALDALALTLADLIAATEPPPEPEPEPAPDPWPVPQNVAGEALVGGARLTWTIPVNNRNVTGVQITWGYDGGYKGGKWTTDGPITTYDVTGLPEGKLVNFDIGLRVDGTNPASTDLVRVNVTTLTSTVPGPEPTDPGAFPASGSWADKEAWIKAVAGPSGDLVVVNSAASAAATGLPIQWSDSWGGILVHEPCTLEGLDIAGQIVLNSGAGHAVRIVNVAFKGLWSNGGHANYLERIRVTHRPHNLGQGALNGLADNNTVKRADLSGFADGIQYRGRLHLVESYFHDAAYTSTTHNDDTQGYPQSSLLVERSLFDHSPPYLNVRNGHIFTDGTSPAGGDIVDSILRVRTNRSSNWVANSHNGAFRYLRCRIDGRFGGAGHTTTDCVITV